MPNVDDKAETIAAPVDNFCVELKVRMHLILESQRRVSGRSSSHAR